MFSEGCQSKMNRKGITNLVIGKELLQASRLHSLQTNQSISEFVRHALHLWTNNQLFIFDYKDLGKLPDGEGIIFQIDNSRIMNQDVPISNPDGVRVLCLKQK